MKKIPEPELADLQILKPAEINRIHFGGNKTPLTPEQIKALANGEKAGDLPKAPTVRKPSF